MPLEPWAHDAPSFLPAAVSLGDTLRRLGRDREAGRVWLRAARLQPLPVLLTRIEELYRELAQPNKVIELYRRLEARGPSFARNLRLVRFLLAQGAVEEASRVLVSTPSNGSGVEGALLRGEIERRRENPSAALESLHIAFDAWPEAKRPHLCSACSRGISGWSARCPGCGGWNVLHPADDPPATPTAAPSIGALLRRFVTR